MDAAEWINGLIDGSCRRRERGGSEAVTVRRKERVMASLRLLCFP